MHRVALEKPSLMFTIFTADRRNCAQLARGCFTPSSVSTRDKASQMTELDQESPSD